MDRFGASTPALLAALALVLAALGLAACGGEPCGGVGALGADDLAVSQPVRSEVPVVESAAAPSGPPADGGAGESGGGGGGGGGGSRTLALDLVVPIFPGVDTYSGRCDPFDDALDACM